MGAPPLIVVAVMGRLLFAMNTRLNQTNMQKQKNKYQN